MKPQFIAKILLDLVMTILLLFQMAYHLTGEVAHEWIGAGMLVLFVSHNLLNRTWYATIFKGKYSPYRILQTAITLLVFIAMLGLMLSGIILSKYVFDFLHISGYLSFARKLHMLGAFWGFPLMSLHLGLHWNMVMGMIQKFVKLPAVSLPYRAVLLVAAVLVSAYGAVVFLRYDLFSYMILKNQFVSFDYEQPMVSFFCDYLSMMGLWIFVAHVGTKRIRLRPYRGKLPERNPNSAHLVTESAKSLSQNG